MAPRMRRSRQRRAMAMLRAKECSRPAKDKIAGGEAARAALEGSSEARGSSSAMRVPACASCNTVQACVARCYSARSAARGARARRGSRQQQCGIPTPRRGSSTYRVRASHSERRGSGVPDARARGTIPSPWRVSQQAMCVEAPVAAVPPPRCHHEMTVPTLSATSAHA